MGKVKAKRSKVRNQPTGVASLADVQAAMSTANIQPMPGSGADTHPLVKQVIVYHSDTGSPFLVFHPHFFTYMTVKSQ